MNGSFDVQTLVFAILAIVVVWKLRSVLGTRTGAERPPLDIFNRRKPTDPNATAASPAEGSNVIPLPGAADRPAAPLQGGNRWTGYAEEGSAVGGGLDQIAAADSGFAVKPFLDGARAAYETIILAFAKGDRQVLEPLLAKDVYEGFVQAIAEREAKGETVETTIVSIRQGEIVDAQVRGITAQIVVRFHTQLITITRARDGTPVGEATDKVSELVDVWTFARDVTSRNPNWKLVATETGQ